MERDNDTTIVIGLLSLVLLAIVAASLPLQASEQRGESSETVVESNSSESWNSDDGIDGISLLSFLPTVFLVLLGLVGLIAAVTGYQILTRSADDRTSTPPVTETEPAETSLENVATVAGTAADRIQRTDSSENEIYRAWTEMTRILSVSNPRTKTSGEFATAAIRAGMDEEDVSELTDLFDRVRYGNWEPTAEDEQYAIEVLERIEDSYHSDRS